MPAATRHEPAALALEILIAQSETTIDAIARLPFGHSDHDSLLASALDLDRRILTTPARNLQDQIAQFRLLLAILIDQENVGPYAEQLARKVLADMEATAAN